jgi:DUF4097 and DUF4098 domain-containing protein YvlB
MRLSLLVSGALVLAGALPLGAQDRDRDRGRDRDRDRDRDFESVLDTTVTLGRGGVVDLSLVSGDVIVTAWARDEARIHARSERGTLEFSASPSRVSLDVRSNRGRLGETRYEVTVPVGTRVLTHSVSADQSVRGTKGDVESVSGDLRAARISGGASGSTVSGGIELADVTGDVRIESTSGDISLSGVQAKVVRAETISGGIGFDGAIDRAGRYEFSAHSGDVTLGLPADVGASVSLETFSGEIESDFPLVIQPSGDERRRRQRRMDVTLGGGGARITVDTFSGNIDLERGTRRDKE